MLHFDYSSTNIFNFWTKPPKIVTKQFSTQKNSLVFMFISSKIRTSVDWSNWIWFSHQYSAAAPDKSRPLLRTFNDQNNTDSVYFKKAVKNVFTLTEFHTSSETEVFRKIIPLSVTVFLSIRKTSWTNIHLFYLLKFDADDAFPSKTVKLQVKFSFSDYLSSYAATLPSQNPSAIETKLIHTPIQCFHIFIGVLHKKQAGKKVVHSAFHQLPWEKIRCQKQTRPHLFLTQRWNTESLRIRTL